MTSPSSFTRRSVVLAAASLLAACATPPQARTPAASAQPADLGTPTPTASPEPAGAQDRATVPVLCYHQVRDWTSSDSTYSRQLLVCPPASFREQLDGLRDAGYATITPDAYLDHLRTGTPLPARPVLLTFDDGKDSQALVAGPELSTRGMVGTFFVMSVVIGKKGWITARQIRELADAGHTIGSHTWDHHQVTSYSGDDWVTQFAEPRETLRTHSGQAVETFAYPYGAWNAAALPRLVEAGYTTAFQLQEKPVDAGAPALTLRRILANSTWSAAGVVKAVGRAV